jgi:UDP-sulfoquinovose synthase
LTVYGKGGQTRGYLNLRDTLACVGLAAVHPPQPGELRILNQFTETFSVNELAWRVRSVGARLGLSIDIDHIENPRKEAEEHYYNPVHSGLLELGLKPHYLTDDVIASMLERVLRYRDRIAVERILPRVRWS